MMTPGRSERCAARIWMKIMKQTPKLPVVTMKGIILCLLVFRPHSREKKGKKRKEKRSTMASPIPSVIEQSETMQRRPGMLLRLLGWGWSRCLTGIRASSIFVCRASWLWDSLPLGYLTAQSVRITANGWELYLLDRYSRAARAVDQTNASQRQPTHPRSNVAWLLLRVHCQHISSRWIQLNWPPKLERWIERTANCIRQSCPTANPV